MNETPETLRALAERGRPKHDPFNGGWHVGGFAFSEIDAHADAWEADIAKWKRILAADAKISDARLQLCEEQAGEIVDLQKRLEAAERRWAETALAWRSGEKPGDYPRLVGEEPDACPACGTPHDADVHDPTCALAGEEPRPMRVDRSYVSPDLETMTNYDTNRDDAKRHADLLRGPAHPLDAREETRDEFDYEPDMPSDEEIEAEEQHEADKYE